MSSCTDRAGLQQIIESIQARCDLKPDVAILLGTGLGGLADRIEAKARIPYAEIPPMPVSTAESHSGEVVLGTLGGANVVAFSGRLHCYEGYAAAEVVAPVRVAKMLGAHTLVMGSAVGGLDPRLQVADITVIEDHINFMGVNPLVGPNDDELGPRWPDMVEPYALDLIEKAEGLALEKGVPLKRATYVGVLGPNLETRAEYRMIRQWGADIVGMSTVPEAIAAVHCGMKTVAFAIVTDRCLPDALEAADIQAIIAAAGKAEPILSDLVTGLIPVIAKETP